MSLHQSPSAGAKYLSLVGSMEKRSVHQAIEAALSEFTFRFNRSRSIPWNPSSRS